MDDAVQINDAQRTVRAFIAAASSWVGMDQSLPSQDAYAVNVPRQYQTIGPGGLVGVEGTSLSNGQGVLSVASSPLVLLALGGVVVYLLVKHG